MIKESNYNVNSPFFSIITVCYNSADTIERTLKSVLNQTFQDYEYIIIDGKSTDRTIEIIKKYEKYFGNKLKLISEKDKGLYDAMNKGIHFSKGKVIGIINSDDWYLKECLELIHNNYKENIQIFYGDIWLYKEIDKKCFIKKKNSKKPIELLKGPAINHPSCFIKRELYATQKYNIKRMISADYELLLKFYLNGYNFKYIKKPYVFMKIGGLSSKYFKRSLSELNDIRKSILYKNNFIVNLKYCFYYIYHILYSIFCKLIKIMGKEVIIMKKTGWKKL